MAFISGKSVDELRQGSGSARPVVVGSVFFVLGFTTVFVLLGISATGLGRFLLEQIQILSKIAGVAIVLLGLSTLGFLRLPFLMQTAKLEFAQRPPGNIGAYFLGAAFAFGWTPCIGPILAAILAYAATKDTLIQGVVLLSVYSMGLGIPFILTAFSLQAFLKWSTPIKRHFRWVEVISGVLLIAVGILIYTGSLTRLVNYLGFFNRFAL